MTYFVYDSMDNHVEVFDRREPARRKLEDLAYGEIFACMLDGTRAGHRIMRKAQRARWPGVKTVDMTIGDRRLTFRKY